MGKQSDLEAEILAEESTTQRLERLAKGQRRIFDEARHDRFRNGLGIFVIFLGFCVVMIYTSNKFQDSEEARDQARIGNCEQDNKSIDRIREFEKQDIRDTLETLLEGEVTPELRIRLDAFYLARDERVDGTFKKRVCTLPEIEKYVTPKSSEN